MYTIALTLSIISSLLVIVYLLMLIFGRNKQETITISGRIVTKTVTYSEPVEVSGRLSKGSLKM